MRRYAIYHLEREYAQVLGDPCVGVVFADDSEHAEEKARERWYLPTGALAVQTGGPHE